jgi:hypothetical protein
MDRRYAVFVSSTCRDFPEERKLLRDVIINDGHIPTGMENFDPAHEPPWNQIRPAIRECDRFILVVGWEYGTAKGKVSYTEQEYNFASDQGKPLIVLMKEGTAPEDVDQRVTEFRRRLRDQNIVQWSSMDDFRNVVTRQVRRWIDKPQGDEGWVRYREYTTVKEQRDRLELERDVFAYLLNRLNPYRDIHLKQFLKELHAPFTSMRTVLVSLKTLIHHYVTPIVDPSVRVYFAYELPDLVVRSSIEPRGYQLVGAGDGDTARYRVGISNTRDAEQWNEGLFIGKVSNVHRVFETKRIRGIPDATRLLETNAFVSSEGSVLAVPVVYGESEDDEQRDVLGVIALSSPKKGEVTAGKYVTMAEELQTIFSALFYAYGHHLQKRGHPEDTIPSLLRQQIAAYYRNEYVI